MSAFNDAFTAFFDAFVELEPIAATAIGDHRHDGRWPDLSEAGRRARLSSVDAWLAMFSALDPGVMTRDEAIDRDIVVGELESLRFSEAELREDAWNPLAWIYLLGEGIFPLLAREFAPLADRLTSVASRLETLPAVTAAGMEQLVGVGADRPVGKFQTEAAIDQLPGIVDLMDEALGEADRAAEAGNTAVDALRPRLIEAAATARVALDRFGVHLRERVLPASDGDGRLGANLFAAKMRHTMRSDELTPE